MAEVTVTLYREEIVPEFEENMSWLRQTTVTEIQRQGNQAVFLVAGSGGASAVTRGVNSLIPARVDSNTQNTCTLVEWHDLVRKTRFNIFQSQGDQRALMQRTTRAVLNRRLDQDIITQLDTATNNLGGAAQASSSLIRKAKVKLGQNEVPVEDMDKMWAVVSDAFMGYIEELPEFASADYVDYKPYTGPARRVLRWKGFNWIVHHNLSGAGTASEKCYFYHSDAIGSAFDMDNLNIAIGYEDEQDYSYARASSFTGAKLLQQSGIVQVLHDASNA
jgi:hypothetical protein